MKVESCLSQGHLIAAEVGGNSGLWSLFSLWRLLLCLSDCAQGGGAETEKGRKGTEGIQRLYTALLQMRSSSKSHPHSGKSQVSLNLLSVHMQTPCTYSVPGPVLGVGTGSWIIQGPCHRGAKPSSAAETEHKQPAVTVWGVLACDWGSD